MKKRTKCLLSVLLCVAVLAGCGNTRIGEKRAAMSVEDARTEINALLSKVSRVRVEKPKMDIYTDDISETAALDSIDTFGTPVVGKGSINIEIAAATELSQKSPDDWINVVAQNFNGEKKQIGGRTVSVTIRSITSGEVYTYVSAGAYMPNAAITSNEAWGMMLETSGIKVNKLSSRIAGNTAGILISKDAEKKVIDAYGEVTFGTVIQAAMDESIVFGYTNPYTSSTGLNGLTQMLKVFDNENPLSDKASKSLMEYQKTAPPVAYTTAVLQNQAAKGIVDAMVMEEQAYINTPELSGYTYIPFGIRHDHPFYTFSWNTPEEEEAAKMFAEYCLEEKNQKIATEKGFNRHDEYKSEDSGLTGQGYITAQSMWKKNKNGGRPVLCVFIADVSGSMNGTPITSMQKSVKETLPYIGSENYVALVSYSSDVTIHTSFLTYEKDENGNLKANGVQAFDDKQRAYFSGELDNLVASGQTSTYDAVLVALDMINTAEGYLPNATPLIILLTDGAANSGYSLSRISGIVEGMRVPVYCISYNYGSDSDLEKLSGLNEASTIKAGSENITNQLRNLFNTQL